MDSRILTTLNLSSFVFCNTVDIESLILSTIQTNESIADTWAFSQAHGIDHQAVIGAMKSLLIDKYICEEKLECSFWTLTEEGAGVAVNGAPEYQVFMHVPAEGILLTGLQAALGDVAKIGLG